jgi:ribosome biogenesis GTPase A
MEWFRGQGHAAVSLNSREGAGTKELAAIIISTAAKKLAVRESKGRGTRAVRAMVVGIPNVGKSSLINRLAGRSGAKTGDRPGVTRGQQWIRVNSELELLDTPGVLWPKFADPEVGYRLAITGAIDDRLFSAEAVAVRLITWLRESMSEQLMNRYGLADVAQATAEAVLEEIGRKRGCLLAGGVADMERAASTLISELRGGRLGPVTLEMPPRALGPSGS